jgi:hypothetical protein
MDRTVPEKIDGETTISAPYVANAVLPKQAF